ncbi:MAG: DEAD/DEAH box helicase [Clostridium sp.]|nr:DEAD/DEAH box helicase [Clostridium sp.]
MLTCREMAPDLNFAALRIEGRDETFHGLELMGTLSEFFDGRDAVYWVSGKHFNRVPGDFAEAIRPLRESADQGRVRVRIGRKHLESFIYDVLPYLRRFAEVEVPQEEEIRQMLPPRESLRFYLDAAGGTASCRLCAVMPAREENPETETILLPGSDNLTGRREKAAKLVREYFPEVSGDGTLFTTGSREDYLYLLLEEGLDRLLMAGEVQTTDSFRRIRVRRRPGISVGVQLSGDLLQLDLAGSDLTEEEMEEILANYQPKKRFYRLKSGDFINLRDNSIEELEALMEGLRMSPQEFVRGKMHIPAYRTLYLDRMLQQSEDLYTLRDTRFKAMVRAFRNVGDADFAIPEALTGVLRKYQKVGYRWLRTLASAGFGGILADEMGLGKTVQVIALLEAERESEESGRTGAGEAGEPVRTGARSLIVAPASLVYNWGAEAGRFAPKLKVLLITGTQEERAALLEDPGDADVLVTSYDLLKRDIDLYSGLDFRYEIIDEAQFIKNHTTAAAKAVKLVNSRVRFALTGTPIENRLAELWSIFDYLMPGFLYSYEEFRRLFENPIVRDGEETASDRLMKMISPFILRRMKRDVLKDLPEKLEEVRYSALEGQQRRLYDAQVLHMRQMLAMESAEDFNRNRMKILAELMRARQICCDPSLCYADYDGPSAKREAFRELVKSAIDGEHRVLVFSQFTSMLDLLKKDMEKENIPYYCITGATPKEERAELTERFNRGNVPVFFISLRAGGTGLNLTGADVVIHYDPWWNLAVENQATDRAHRIGQQRKVTVYRLVMKGTLEERILAMQEAKKKLAEDILGAEQMGQGAITKEELSELLSGDV